MNIIRKLKNYVKKHFYKKIPVYIPVFNGQLMENRVVLISGGTSGIGYSIAEEVVKNGGVVVITGRNKERLDISIDKLKKNNESAENRIFGFVMDVSNVESLESSFSYIIENIQENRLDTLVNSAGIGGGEFGELQEDQFDKIMDTNLKGTFFLCQLMAKYLKENKIKGNILNLASSSSLRPAFSAYTLSKWGIRGFTLGLAKALIPYGIVVNGIAPGPTATPMLTNDTNNLTLPGNPTGRYGTSQEVANLALFLMSSMGRMIVGDIVYMTGGAGLFTFDDVTYNY